MQPHSLPLPATVVATEQITVSPGHKVAGSSLLPRFLTIAFQLALILLTVYLFRLEPNRPLLAVMCLAAGGFLVHAWLPRRFCPAFFCLLSLASAVLLLGWSAAGWVLGIGGGLIALCHLPMLWVYRLLLIAGAGGVLALWRIESREAFWPVLASMFMFRLIVYMYDLYNEERRPPLLHTLAYFFPLPNLCFVFFPVLDFKTFRETYYNDEPYTIYQSGVGWIVRGLTHLLAYRFIKYYLLPAPHEMTDLPHLLLFLATNYALYLRVSGWFHIATGMLHLFGFNLPRTHHHYFLASSFSDVWRRINIYWKDFMAKVFYFPAFFALRRWGTRLALTAACLGVFVATWLLHSYQMFWLRSELPLSWNEAALWLTAGVVMIINLLLELRRSKKAPSLPSLAVGKEEGIGWLQREAAAGATLTLQIIGTFLLVSVFWACWTLPQFPSYLYVLATSGAITAAGALTVLGWVASCVTAGALVQLAWRRRLCRRGALPRTPSFPVSAALPTAALLVLVAAGTPGVDTVLGPQTAEVLATLRLEATTPVEAAVAVQGYYEEVADTPVQASPLLALPALPQKKRSTPAYANLMRPADDDFLEQEVTPNWSGQRLGRRLTTNSLGMRDREGIAREKPAGVCRLAFVGTSVVMGHGVGDDETFTRLLDAEMNAERPVGARRCEVLNFGQDRSDAIHCLTLITRKVFDFDPDAIYYVAHQAEYEYEWTVRHLGRLVARRNELPVYLEEIVQRAGIGPETPQNQAEVRLQLFAPEIVRGTYADIVKNCRKLGILPVWVYVPMPGIVDAAIQSSKLAALAEEAGFVVFNLAKWADGYAPEAVKAGKYHPNALGHRLIAERLNAALQEHPSTLPACARP